MVNPGAFQGARKAFLMGEKQAYSEAVDDGYVAEAVVKIQRRFFKRFPVDLPDHEEPTPEQLAAVDDEEIEPDSPEPDPAAMSKEEYDAAMMKVGDRQRKLAFRRGQIKRWLAYQYMKDHDVDVKASGAHNPYRALLCKLTGQQSARPRTKTACNVWRKTKRDTIEKEVKVRALALSTPKTGMAALRDKVAKGMFQDLSREERKHWQFVAEQESIAAQTAWDEEVNGRPSTAPEDRQRCILGLVRFIQPILQLVCDATGWKATFIAGGPEPAHQGKLNIISIHCGKTSGDVPLDFGALERDGYKKNFLPIYGRFLKKCYSVEECHSRALKPEESLSLDAAEVEQEGAGLFSVEEPCEGRTSSAPSCLPPQVARKAPKAKKGRSTAVATAPARSAQASTVTAASRTAPDPPPVMQGPAHTPASVLVTPHPAPARSPTSQPSSSSPSPGSLSGPSSAPLHRAPEPPLPPSPPQSPSLSSSLSLPPDISSTTSRPSDIPAPQSCALSQPPSRGPSPPPSRSPSPRQIGAALLPPSRPASPPPSRPASPPPSRPASPPPSRPSSPPPRPSSSPPSRPSSPPPSRPSSSPPSRPSSPPPSRPSSSPPSRPSSPLPSRPSSSPPSRPASPPPSRPPTPPPTPLSSLSGTMPLSNLGSSSTTPSAAALDTASCSASDSMDTTSTSQAPRRSKRRRSVGPSDIQPPPAKRGRPTKRSQAVVVNNQASTPLPVVVGPEAPEWFVTIVEMLQSRTLDMKECWMALVRKWSDFEAREGYEGVKRLSATHRPDVIAAWLHRKRSPNFQPDIDLRRYPKAYMSWWTAIQPEWRVSGKKVMYDQVEGDWEVLRRAGVNGLVNVLVALFYWGCAVKEGSRSANDWEFAVNDCSTVVTQLLTCA